MNSRRCDVPSQYWPDVQSGCYPLFELSRSPKTGNMSNVTCSRNPISVVCRNQVAARSRLDRDRTD